MSIPTQTFDHDGLKPGRLRSLWDIMFAFDAATLHSVVTAMARTLRSIEDVKSSNPQWAAAGPYGPPIRNRAEIEVILERAQKLKPILEQIGARVTLAEVERHLDEMKKGWIYQDFLRLCYERIVDRLEDELALVNLYALDAERAKYFEPKDPLFGKQFQIAFASAAFELDEAGKCLALGRSTACVFHLMRLMEIGLTATALCLSISPPNKAGNRNWGAILRSISDAMNAKSQAGTWTNNDKALFAEIYASLEAVRTAWRNATMHVENKYMEDEAEHIFVAVRGFMNKLASRCDETGSPPA